MVTGWVRKRSVFLEVLLVKGVVRSFRYLVLIQQCYWPGMHKSITVDTEGMLVKRTGQWHFVVCSWLEIQFFKFVTNFVLKLFYFIAKYVVTRIDIIYLLLLYIFDIWNLNSSVEERGKRQDSAGPHQEDWSLIRRTG